MAKRRSHGMFAAVFALLALAGDAGWAQESGPAVPVGDRPIETEASKTLGPAEILRAAETAQSEIHELTLASLPGETVQRVSQGLTELENEIANLESRLESRRLERLDLGHLAGVESSWEQQRSRLERWRQLLEQKAVGLQTGIDSLKRIEARWRSTRDAIAGDPAAAAVMDRVQQTLDLAVSAASEAGGHLPQVLDLENRVFGELRRVREAQSRIGAARSKARHTLIGPEDPPLWQFLSTSRDHGLTRDVSGSLVYVKIGLTRFFRNNIAPFFVHLLLTVALIALTLRLRWGGSRREDQDPASVRTAGVLARPFAAALLVSLLLTRWVYDKPPQVVLNLAVLLSLLPLMRLLPVMAPSRLRMPLFGLGALLLVERIKSLVPEQTLLERLLLLLLIGLGGAGLVWLLRPAGALAGPRVGWLSQLLYRLAWFAVGLLAMALVANVIGSVMLAALITEAVFLSAYVGVLFLTSYVVLNILIHVLVERSRARSIRLHAEAIRSRFRQLFRFGFVVWWVYATLVLFHVRDPVVGMLGQTLARTWTVGNMSLSIATVLIFVITLWISVVLSRIIHALLNEDVLPRLKFPRGVPATISMMSRYGVIAVGVLAAASAAGIHLSQFAIMIGALGVGIGFGMQNLVNNFISGLILAFERPIQAGDTVETGTIRGVVQRIGLRASILRTPDGAEVIVPNGNLISSEVTNWTLSDRARRMTVSVGVRYGSDPRKVIEILLQAANRHAKVARHPEAVALFVGFGESSLDFLVRFWTDHDDDSPRVQSEVAIGVNDALTEAGIEIPFPQRDVHLRTVRGHGDQ